MKVMISLIAILMSFSTLGVEGLLTRQSAYSVDKTLERLESSLKKRGFTIFAHIDHAKAASSVGLEMARETLVIFGKPKAGTPSFIKTPTLGIDLPLKALVWEDRTGKVFVSYNSSEYIFKTIYFRHGTPFKNEMIAKIGGALKAIVNETVQGE